MEHLVQKAEELRESDLSPKVCIGIATKESLVYPPSSDSSPNMSVDDRRKSMSGQEEKAEDIDAFFSRFSIDSERKETHERYDASPRAKKDIECNEKLIHSVSPEKVGEVKNVPKSDQHQQCIDRVVSQNEDVTEALKAKSAAERESKRRHQSGDRCNKLPKHLGLWKSPWQRHHVAHIGPDDIHPDSADGLSTVGSFSCLSDGKKRLCSLPRNKRVAGHAGYSKIDFYSLYEASVVQAKPEDIDQAPWEYRDVGQRFLSEKSVESRNWFGSFTLMRGNDRVPNAVCRPKSIEVSVTKIAEEGEWSEDWYTTWKSRRDNPNNLITFDQDDTVDMDEEKSRPDSPTQQQDDSSKEKKLVEIGGLCPVRVRCGDQRISRVHPDFTSSLRQSRWRQKFLAGSMFPTD